MGMALDEPEDGEQPEEVNGIGVLVAAHTRPFVDDMVIDYVKQPYGEGFVIQGAGSC